MERTVRQSLGTKAGLGVETSNEGEVGSYRVGNPEHTQEEGGENPGRETLLLLGAVHDVNLILLVLRHHERLTVRELAGNKLQRLVQQQHGQADLQHGHPLGHRQGRDLEHRLRTRHPKC